MGKSGKMDKKKKEIIRRIAYRIYQERQRLGIPGDALSDWIKAEEEYKKMFKDDKKRDN